MNFKKVSISIFILAFFINAKAQQPIIISAPNKNIKAEFWLSNSGEPVYSVIYNNKNIVLPSTLGFEYKLGIHAKDTLNLRQNFSWKIKHRNPATFLQLLLPKMALT